MSKIQLELRDGGEWSEHEDCIIGTECGLKNLISACEAAIEKGEYYSDDLGEYMGVKKIDASWFPNPEESKSSKFINLMLTLILISLVGLIFVGGYTVILWLF